MFNRFELIGGAASIGIMIVALYLVQVRNTLPNLSSHTLSAQVAGQGGVVVVNESADETAARTEALQQAMDKQGKLTSMVTDDVKIGTGEAVKDGDTVSVHYIGTLQNGMEFDNSKKRGQPFEFTVGDRQVIEGWDKGLLGMKVGGQRMLVIPPEMGYGANPIGSIPANSTLVFAIELLEIK